MNRWQPKGLIAVDKQGDRILFLDPISLATLDCIPSMPSLPHELALNTQRTKAFVPAYGDGIHGDNPHPNHYISVIDLQSRKRVKDIDISPLTSPHTLRFGPSGLLYVCCENSAVVAAIDTIRDQVIQKWPTGSSNTHRLTILPETGKIVTENEEDATLTVLDLSTGRRVRTIPLSSPTAGITHLPDERRIVVTDAQSPRLLIVDIETGQLTETVTLTAHKRPAQVVKCDPHQQWLVAIGDHEPVLTAIHLSDWTQKPAHVGNKPMDGDFHPDGKHFLVANEGDGTLSEVLLSSGATLRTVPAGKGCETLAFF
ncbi:cytochrome D1 domain-containing protein [Acetobacter sp. P1H12_c]|uniref:cytochrome D1 domain-containing protein n=1 Tax=Acetobacter sp. P1H12_c TaxID=2762621 RepID=UPI001C051EC9|nr:cytochrome D1 domain-containing protein [Acetobacter sp. P1H12_c]